MADGYTYGLTFPFRDSFDGKYLNLTSMIVKLTKIIKQSILLKKTKR
jgi:hypothetical protein